jgi:hypothetical protein
MKYLILTLVLVAACSTNNKNSNECEKWSMRCYQKAQSKAKEKKLKEAYTLFKKGCKSLHSHSCADAGYIASKLNLPDDALKFSKKSCTFGDEIGCYNYACYECRNNKVKVTMDYLEKSFRLGGRSWSKRADDPDLKCLSSKIIKKIKGWDKHAVDNISQTLSHTFFPTMFSSIIIPQGYKLTSTSPLILIGPLGATLIHSFDPPYDLDKNLKMLKVKLKNKKTLIKKKYRKNGFEAIYSKVIFDSEDKNSNKKYIQLASITKTPRGNMLTHATYPENMSHMFESTMGSVIATTIYNPEWKVPSKIKDFAKDHFSKFNLKYAGLYTGGYVYTEAGSYELFKTYPFLKVTKTSVAQRTFDFSKEALKKLFSSTLEVISIKKLTDKNMHKDDHFYELDIKDSFTRKKYKFLYSLKKTKGKSAYFAFSYFHTKTSDIDFVSLVNGINPQ